MHSLALFLDNTPDPAQIMQMMTAMAAFFVVFYVVGVAIIMVPCWFICKKAGFSPWLSLLCIVPTLGTLVLFYILAFADWKVMPAPVQGWAPPYPPQPPQPPYPQV